MEHNEEELNCPINYTLSILGGKRKWAILENENEKEISNCYRFYQTGNNQ